MRSPPRQAVVAHDLTEKEQTHVRTALTYLRVQFGGWVPLAKLLHTGDSNLMHVVASQRAATPTIAFRVARLVKIPIDDLLAGKFPPAGTCPHCGQTIEPQS